MKTLKHLFVLFAATAKQAIAVLDFPADIDDFITYAKGLHDSMANSSYFSTLAAKLLTLSANIATLTGKQVGLHTHPPTTTTAQRDNALVTVQNNLRDLRLDVQALANASPAIANDIIAAAGMKVKQQGAINKQDLVAKDGPVSGSVDLVAKGSGESRSANEWGYSADGTNWTQVTSTLAAKTIVSGLIKGSILDFRHRYIHKDGPTDWTIVEGHVVK